MELKPCPFCGGAAHLIKMGWPHSVFCEICGAKVTSTGYGDEGDQKAIDKWNSRT